jgi:transposase
MATFLDCFKNNGYNYLRIIYSKRFKKEDGKITNKRVVIKNLGSLKKFDDGKGEGLLLRLREEFKNKKLNIGINYDELPKQIERIKPAIENPIAKLDPKNIGYFFLENIFNKLGISDVITRYKSDNDLDYDVLGLTKLLVFGRILNPKSKKKTFENKNKYLFDITTSKNIKDVYKVLDVLNDKSESIQKRINTKIKQSSIGRNADITYYDVTNYYFETMYGDDDTFLLDEEGNKVLDKKGKPIILEKGFRKKGVSKKYVPNPLVAMGLFIDSNGIPVSFETFPGNTQDKTTFKSIIKSSLNKQDLGKIIVVADNGIYAQENMYLLVNNKNGYIISKSVKKHWETKLTKEEEKQGIQKVKNWALEETGYEYIYKNNEITFKSKSRVYDRTLKDSDGNAITIKEKQVIFWSKKHYDKELHQNAKFIEYLESCKENPDKLKDKQRKSQEFIKVIQTDKKTGEVLKTKPVVILLDEKIQKYKETLGFYSIVTSEIDISDKEIINKYHGLSRIEDSFRIISKDLEGRPIYVWTKEHINAHFLICFIALTIIRLIQHKALKYQGKDTLNTDSWEQGITAEKIKESLNNFNANLIGDGYHQLAEINESLRTIIKSLGIEIDLTLPNISQISNLKDRVASIKL